MADEKITELAELAEAPADDDLLTVVDVSESPDLNKKITALNLLPKFADNETPSGDVDSSNKEFTLANTPNPSSSLLLIGTLVIFTQGVDYTLSTNTITFTDAPPIGSTLRAFYRY